MSSPWTHKLCETCWTMLYHSRIPTRLNKDKQFPCCLCGMLTTSGIYYREDPTKMLCGGKHDE